MKKQKPVDVNSAADAQSSLNVGLGKRLMKCLRNVERHKYPDFDAVFILEEKGYITISGPSDDLSIEITDKGRTALSPNVKVRSGGDE